MQRSLYLLCPFATVLMENRQMLQLFKKMGFNIEKRSEGGVYELTMSFRE